MASSAQAVPQGYHSITPYLAVDGATAAIEFYKEAFGATEVMRMPAPGGRIGHAEIEIGDSRIMLADEHPDMGFRSPRTYRGSPVGLHLYVADVDAVAKRAVAAGATTASGIWLAGASTAAGICWLAAGWTLPITPRSSTGPARRPPRATYMAMPRLIAKKRTASTAVDFDRKLADPREPNTVAEAPAPKPEPAAGVNTAVTVWLPGTVKVWLDVAWPVAWS